MAATSLATVVAVMALAGCSGGSKAEKADPSASPTSSPSASPSSYLPVPDDVSLTGQGSALNFGDAATVAWRPTQRLVGVIDVTVLSAQRTTFKQSFVGWKLSGPAKTSTPYFVRVQVTNTGESDLGGQQIPLYIVDGADTLVEASSFVTDFKPCPSGPLPTSFGPGETTKACLVYLSPDHGALTAVSFRPTQEFNPITWSGDVEPPATPTARSSQKSKQ